MSIYVSVTDAGPIKVVKFTNPKARNPLSSEILEELHYLIDNLDPVNGPGTIVFTGSEDVFASGANLREIAALDPGAARAFAAKGQSLMNKIADLEQ